MNILFLGGAKRVSMARMFKQAAEARGEKAQIFSYEMSRQVPISIMGRVIVGLRWSDPAIYDDLWRVVKANNIGIIVPFVDGAVAVAAELAARHPEEVFAPTSNVELCRAMYDKVTAADLFERASLPIPTTYTGESVKMPLIAKPRYGSASKGLIEIDNDYDLSHIADRLSDYLIQERIDNREEYTADCYVSLTSGDIVTIVPRKRIEVVGGEVTRTATVIRPEVFDLAKAALERLGLRGAVTVQVLHDLDTDRYLLMEINPRLGGGAVCAVHAGVDLPGFIIEDSKGISTPFKTYRPYTEIARYPQEVAFME